MSQLPLAGPLKWLGYFGIIHGLSEWFVMAWLLDFFAAGYELLLIKQLLTVISYLCLAWFGTGLLKNLGSDRMKLFRYLLINVAIVWVIVVATRTIELGLAQNLLLQCQFIYNYGVGFPGAIFSALGLLTWAGRLEREGLAGFWHLRLLGWLFVAYGFFSAILIGEQSWFPANLINQQNFTLLTGIPVELVRLLILAAVTGLFLKVIQIFIWEKIAHITSLNTRKAALEERQRIGRELHDVLVQDIFALSLQLERAMQKKENIDPTPVKESIDRLLNQSRGYLKQQQDYANPETLEERLRKYLSSLEESVDVKFKLEISPAPLLKNISTRTVEHIFYIIQEAVTNALKHSGSDHIVISVGMFPAGIRVKIADKGSWVKPGPGSGLGLDLVRQRAKAIGADLKIHGSGKGTQLVLTLPWERGVAKK